MFVIAALVGLLACGGQSPKPCTQCADLSGTYQASQVPGSVTCDNENLTQTGAAGAIFLTQDGSKLTLGIGSTQFTGTLHTDNSALFGPARDTAIAGSDMGVNQAGSVYIAGFFTQASAGSRFDFDGTYFFIQDSNGCEVDSKMTWR